MTSPLHASGPHLIGTTSDMLSAYSSINAQFPVIRRDVVRINSYIESALREAGERRILIPRVDVAPFPFGVRLQLKGEEMWDVFPSIVGVGSIEDLLPDDIAAHWDPARLEPRPFHLKALACALVPNGVEAFERGEGAYTVLVGNRIHLNGKVYRNKPV